MTRRDLIQIFLIISLALTVIVFVIGFFTGDVPPESFIGNQVILGVIIALASTWCIGLILFVIQTKSESTSFKKHEKECFEKQNCHFKELVGRMLYYEEKNEAGIESLHPSRKQDGPTIAIIDEFLKSMGKEKNEIKILGTTLRAFTNNFGGMYYPSHDRLGEMYEGRVDSRLTEEKIACLKLGEMGDHSNLLIRLLEANPNSSIKMIVLSPHCLESFFRANAENDPPDSPFAEVTNYERQNNPCLYSDVEKTIKFVEKVKSKLEPKYRKRIELRLSYTTNSMFLLI